jgi:Bifunctional DNA primase/polymerase, N-terminal
MRSLILETALSSLERGWSVVPVNREKTPLGRWQEYQSRAMTPREAEVAFSRSDATGVAVVLGSVSGVCCLDFDGRAGRRVLARVNKLLPDGAAKSLTGSGGLHVFMGHRAGLPFRHFHHRQFKDGEVIERSRAGELRAEGGVVVLPPSLHPSGRTYRWLIEPGSSLPEVPTELEAALFPPEPKPSLALLEGNLAIADNRLAAVLLERALDRARGEGRNATGFWLACQLRDNGFGKDEAGSVLLQYTDFVHQDPHPYHLKEALASLSSAYRRAARGTWVRAERPQRQAWSRR